MAYTKYIYNKTNWINKSEGLTTPIGKERLNNIENGIYNIAENLDIVYNEMSTGKFDEADADKVIVGMPTWDPDTGIFTIRFYDGTEFSMDFNIEKIPVSFSMDSAGVITMTTADGTEWAADIGDVMPDYTFEDSERIAFTRTKNADGSYTVTADIKKNSITGDYLEPNYLADITTQASNASASAKQAADSADAADYDAKMAQSYAIGGSGVREGEDTDNAKYYSQQAATSASDAFDFADEASSKAAAATTSEANAKTYETNALTSANAAKASETSAANSESVAIDSAEIATNKAEEASTSALTAADKASDAAASADNAANSAVEAKSYTRGDTGTRTNENIDNAKYYYEQSKSISESFSGALRPMGTVTFANLPTLSIAVEGDMYNISDSFTTTSGFKEGSGNVIPAGANVYKTSDGYWDILAGTPVTSVNGMRGDVSITPNNIGALPLTGGTLTGNAKIARSGDGASPQWIAERSDTNARIWCGVGYGGVNHGVYSDTFEKWLVYADADGGIYLNGTAETATKAIQDSVGQQIDSTYIKNLNVSDRTITYVKGDGTTGTLTTQDTTYGNMTGASASAAGRSGLVPAPAAGAATRYLRSDGTWQIPPDTNTTYSAATASAAGLMSAADKTMMTKLTAGVNKTISSLSLSSVTFTGSSATPYCYMHAGTAISNLVYGHVYTVIVVVNSITGTSGGGIGVAISPATVTKGATAASSATPLSITGVIGGTDKGTYIGTCSVPQGTTTMYAIPVASYGAGSATVNGNVSVIFMY